MRWPSLYVLVLAALTSACWKVPMAPEAPEQYSGFTDHAGDYSQNGFRVVVIEDREQKDVRMEVRYTVGSGQDPKGKEGLAHVVEHLLFEAPVSDAANADTYGQALSRLSLGWNAYTTQDSTSYTTVFAKERLEEVFALEMVRAKRGCRGLSQKQFEREREVVRNEARERARGEMGQVIRAIENFLYVEGHPYRSNVIGTDTSLLSITKQDACAFITKHYHPKNTIIVLSGQVSKPVVQMMTKPWFRSFPRKSPQPTAFPKDSYQESHEQIVHLNVGTPYLFAVWPLAARSSPEYNLQVHAVRGLNIQLNKRLKKADWASSATTVIMGGAKAPALVAAIELNDTDHLGAARSLIADARKALLKRKGKDIFGYLERRATAIEYENIATRTKLFADYEQHRDSSTWRKHLGSKEDPDAKSVYAAARRLFETRAPRFLTIAPKSRQVATEVSSFHYEAGTPRQESSLEPDPQSIKQAHAALPVPADLGKKQEFRRYKMPNGLQLVFWLRPELPLVYGRLLVPVGASQVPTSQSGLSKLMKGNDDYDVTVFSQTTLTENSHGLLYVLAKAFHSKSLAYEDKELDSLRRHLGTKANRVAADYRRELLAAVYGANHPYARTGLRREDISKVSKAAIVEWAKQSRSVQGATLILTGRFDPDLMYRQALYYFRNSPTHSLQNFTHPDLVLPATNAVVSGVYEEQPSLSISLVYRGGRGIDDSQPARDILADIINNRIRKLREEQALTYGMQARYTPERGDGLWWISGDVDAKRSDEAMRLLLETIATLRSDSKGYVHEFSKARMQRMNRVGQQKVTAAIAASRLTYIARYGLEDDYFENYVRALAQTSVSDVEALLQNEFSPSGQVVGLFGPSEAIDQAWKAVLQAPAQDTP